MRKIREALRQRHELGRGHREIARSLSVSHSTIGEYMRRAEEAGVSWPVPAEWDDERLESALFPRLAPSTVARPEPDWSWVHRELGRHKGVTLQLLWLEYKEVHPDGYQYSRFCERYAEWRGRLDVTIRQPYRGGEKAFVDYAGPGVPIVDRATGEIREALVFVAALGASSYTFVDLTWTRSLPDWIASHIRMLESWGGVVELLIPDNEKAGVKEACYYEPDVNRTYHDLATHYGMTVLPARPRMPRDKAKAEAAVQNVERRVLAPLRDQTFFSLTEARRTIAPLLEALNDRPFAKLEGSRRSLFEELDRPALRPLPATRFEYCEWSKARVNIDYHIQVQHHFYSVPHALTRQQVEVRLTASTVEVFLRGLRVAAHARSSRKGGYTTDPGHMPAAHRAHLEWSPSRLVRWAAGVGPATARFVEQLLESRPHPEHGYRSCLGLMRLARSHPAERMEAACRRGIAYRTLSYRSIQSILSTGMDQLPLELEPEPIRLPVEHVHLRGADYYRTPDPHPTTGD